MEKMPTVIVPDSHIAFAKELQKVAKKWSIERFTMEYEPENKAVNEATGHTFYSKLNIKYRRVDGRGRSSDGLCISVNTDLTLHIEKDPESCS